MTDKRWERVRAALDGVKNRGGFWVDVADEALTDLDALRLEHERVVEAAQEVLRCMREQQTLTGAFGRLSASLERPAAFDRKGSRKRTPSERSS